MTRFAVAPILVLLAACSTEAENQSADANQIETLTANNLVVAGENTSATATAQGASASQDAPAEQPGVTALPEPPRAPAAKKAPEPATTSTPKSAPATPAKPEPKTEAEDEPTASDSSCTAEHRAMGHC